MKIKIAGIIGIAVLLCYILYPKQKPHIQKISLPIAYKIEIQGEVAFNRTYTFYYPVTLGMIIELSGGYTNVADTSYDLSKVYSTTSKIIIAKKSQLVSEINPMNLNEATFQMLLTIPGMTENRAVHIIIYRTQVGKFKTIDELLHVKYIKEATFEKIRHYFYI